MAMTASSKGAIVIAGDRANCPITLTKQDSEIQNFIFEQEATATCIGFYEDQRIYQLDLCCLFLFEATLCMSFEGN